MKKFAFYLTLFLLVVLTNSIHSQVVVVINLGNNISNISTDDLKSIYLAEQSEWTNGEKILLTDSKDSNNPSNRFYEMILGMNQRKIRKLWLKKILMGNITSPKSLKNDGEIIEYVSQNKGTIAFINLKNVTDNVKVLTLDGIAPSEDDYILN